MFYPYFTCEVIFIFNRSSKFWAVKIDSFIHAICTAPRALFDAVDIVPEIAFLSCVLSYNVGYIICWSINLRLPRAKLVAFLNTAPVTANGLLQIMNGTFYFIYFRLPFLPCMNIVTAWPVQTKMASVGHDVSRRCAF
jgi:hypothetical protein